MQRRDRDKFGTNFVSLCNFAFCFEISLFFIFSFKALGDCWNIFISFFILRECLSPCRPRSNFPVTLCLWGNVFPYHFMLIKKSFQVNLLSLFSFYHFHDLVILIWWWILMARKRRYRSKQNLCHCHLFTTKRNIRIYFLIKWKSIYISGEGRERRVTRSDRRAGRNI